MIAGSFARDESEPAKVKGAMQSKAQLLLVRIASAGDFACSSSGRSMINELERLRDVSELFTLLSHYADLAAPDRQAWQDRRMQLDLHKSSGVRRRLCRGVRRGAICRRGCDGAD